MRKTRLPVVEETYAEGTISISSDKWYEWLTKHKSFRYESHLWTAITVRNRERNKWYAYKRRFGKLKEVYVGITQDITYERLQIVAEKLSK
jgi:hypothetical protein